MFKTIAIIVAIVIAGILILAANRPDTFRVERSATINSPPEKIFPHIDGFRLWEAWSPWEKIDPAVKRSYSGADSDFAVKLHDALQKKGIRCWIDKHKLEPGDWITDELSQAIRTHKNSCCTARSRPSSPHT